MHFAGCGCRRDLGAQPHHGIIAVVNDPLADVDAAARIKAGPSRRVYQHRSAAHRAARTVK